MRLSTILEETDEEDQGGDMESPEGGEAEEGPQTAAKASAKAAVIVAHGSFDPIHNHHIAMMIVARKRLEDEGFTVVKGFLGLTSQSALKTKCEWALSEEERLHCIRLACDDHEEAKDWIQGDLQGIRLKSGSRYRAHVQEGEDDRATSPLEQEVTVFKVIGEDVEERFPKEIIGPTVVVSRKNANAVVATNRAAHDLLLRCDQLA